MNPIESVGWITELTEDQRKMEREMLARVNADAAIRGFCQENPFAKAWEDALCQSHVNAALAPYLAVPRQVKTEIELLREQLAAAQAKIAALTPPAPEPLPNPMARAVALWPGSQGFIQGIRWRGV